MTNLSNLTQEQIEELQNLNNAETDYSDIPQTVDFSKARFKYYNLEPKKQLVTLRLDADVLAVLKGFGKGYQKKANDILRAVVIDHKMPEIL